MHYEGQIFRPPSEANSILLQVTTGCSHNRCSFCSMYAQSRFSIKDDSIVNADIDFAAQHCRRQNRLFLCDGDALILPQPRLAAILEQVREKLPWVERVGAYANPKNIKAKSVEELQQLHDLGLGIVYLGLESGDNETLKEIDKGADAAVMVEMGRKIRAASIALSITVILGIAQLERSRIHAVETGRVLSLIDPEYVGALSLMLTPGSSLYQQYKQGSFYLLSPRQMLEELRTMLYHTDLSGGYFHANHASNYLPIKARLPGDKEATIELLDRALRGEVALKPDYMRGL
jgi:radical SAM superfamily enzyme YgiQ (UPF0313 family)